MSFFSMTKTVVRNLIAGPVTRPYPVVTRPSYPNTRGHVEITIEKCIFCGICQKKCPTQAIVVNRAQKMDINRFACTACGNCIDNCPKACLANKNNIPPRQCESPRKPLPGLPLRRGKTWRLNSKNLKCQNQTLLDLYQEGFFMESKDGTKDG
jgi:Na+-translocating ferredoxin:NAD+ oxidoreductase RNF subunit RnfB